MPLQANVPVVVEGQEFPFLTLSLAVQPLFNEDLTAISAATCAEFQAFRVEEGQIVLSGEVKRFVSPDIFSDPDIQASVQKFLEAVQEIIITKGL